MTPAARALLERARCCFGEIHFRPELSDAISELFAERLVEFSGRYDYRLTARAYERLRMAPMDELSLAEQLELARRERAACGEDLQVADRELREAKHEVTFRRSVHSEACERVDKLASELAKEGATR